MVAWGFVVLVCSHRLLFSPWQQQHTTSRPNFCRLVAEVTPILTVHLMFGWADMKVQSHRAQTDPSKDVGIKRLWTMASRFLSLATQIHTTKRVCWLPATPMAAIGCTPGLSQHAGCGWMTRRCVWLLVYASGLTSARNMTAPVVSRLTEWAVMDCRVVEVLAGYQDMMPSTTSFIVRS